MVSFRLVALSLVAVAMATPIRVDRVDRRGFLTDIFHDVAEATSTLVHGVEEAAQFAESAFKDLTCAADNFTGQDHAPHTNGIEWYEDAEYLAGLILSSGPAHWIENATVLTIEQIIEGAEAQGSDFLVRLAGIIGLSPEAAALSNEAFPIINHFAVAIVKAIAEEAILVATSPAVAHTVDNFINLVIKYLEQTGINVVERAGNAVLTQQNVPLFITPAITTICRVGELAANGVTSLEACTLNNNVLSQILSEGRILFLQC